MLCNLLTLFIQLYSCIFIVDLSCVNCFDNFIGSDYGYRVFQFAGGVLREFSDMWKFVFP